jgi:sporulation protein YlmC with PRC-barrel domain
MMKSIAAACLASGLLAGAALAQVAVDPARGNMPAEWRASKLNGLAVQNATNEKIGEINELLVDQSGRVRAVVIGVGGFLGMGEHNVAVPFSELKWVEKAQRTTGSGGTTVTSDRAYPDHGMINLSKDQLKALPKYEYRD